MASIGALKAARDAGCLIGYANGDAISARGLTLIVGLDATDEQLSAVVASQLAVLGLAPRSFRSRENAACFSG
jgi:hypothetical protein